MPKKRSSISALKALLKVATDHGQKGVAKGIRKMIARERTYWTRWKQRAEKALSE